MFRRIPLTNEQRHRAARRMTELEKAGTPREQAANAAISQARGERLDDDGAPVVIPRK